MLISYAESPVNRLSALGKITMMNVFRQVSVFFFIGGIQPKQKLLEKQARSCPACGRIGLSRKRSDMYLSLFFIPLLRVKKGTPFLVCDLCGSGYREDGTVMDREQTRTGMNCPRCGRGLELDFVFCPTCGKKL